MLRTSSSFITHLNSLLTYGVVLPQTPRYVFHSLSVPHRRIYRRDTATQMTCTTCRGFADAARRSGARQTIGLPPRRAPDSGQPCPGQRAHRATSCRAFDFSSTPIPVWVGQAPTQGQTGQKESPVLPSDRANRPPHPDIRRAHHDWYLTPKIHFGKVRNSHGTHGAPTVRPIMMGPA